MTESPKRSIRTGPVRAHLSALAARTHRTSFERSAKQATETCHEFRN